MRKFAKITLIKSVCAIVVGGVLCVTSFATGGIKNVTFDKGVDVYDNSKYNIDKKELEAFDSFDINADAGNIKVDGSSLRKLTVETSAGNVKLTDISMDDADIMSDMGNININFN